MGIKTISKKFENTKVVFRRRTLEKDRQWPKEKGQTTINKTLHIYLKVE
jgi:hypothetical protein